MTVPTLRLWLAEREALAAEEVAAAVDDVADEEDMMERQLTNSQPG